MRQGLKAFSNWPTYPQLYVKGELIGGLDIVKELEEAGELQAQFGSTGEVAPGAAPVLLEVSMPNTMRLQEL